MKRFRAFFVLVLLFGLDTNLWAQSFSTTILPPLITNIKEEGDQITVYWDGYLPDSGMDYNLYFTQRSKKDYVKINIKPIKDHFFVVRGLEKNVTYYFAMTSVTHDAHPVESGYSAEESWEMDGAPKKVTVVSELKEEGYVDIGEKSGLVKLGDPHRNGFKGYNIYLSNTPDGKFEKVNPKPIGNVPTYIVRRLAAKQRYYFIFTKVGKDGKEKGRSQVVSYMALPMTRDISGKLSAVNNSPQAHPTPAKAKP